MMTKQPSKKIQTVVRLDDDLRRVVEEQADRERRSVSGLLRNIIADHFSHEGERASA
jgi:predicted transcriptional regulator